MTRTAAAEAQLRKGVAPYCALALIAGQARYGYELARALATAGVVAGAGSVYPLLSRLQADGWILPRWETGGEGSARKYYTLTPAGLAALADFRQLWPQFAAGISQILSTGAAQARPGGGADAQDT